MPLAIICHNVKEMFLGEFNRKLKEALYHLRQTEPFNPWSNAAKREIKELKKGSDRKLITSGMQRDFGMIALHLGPIYGPILHMASTN